MAEFPVNSFTPNAQDGVAVARDAAGNFIVVWQSAGQEGDVGSDKNIYAKRYDSNGNVLSEFRANSFANGSQTDPTVAVDAAGNFVVAWVDTGRPFIIGSPAGNTTNENGIYARRFDSNGSPLGEEFLASRDTTIFPIGSSSPEQQLGQKPTIAMNASGDFVIAWDQFLSPTGANLGVFARRFAENGVPQGDAFKVNLSADANDPDVAIDTVGNLIVTWTENRPESGSNDIVAQRYNSDGIAQGGQFLVNTKVTNSQTYSAVGVDAAGNFVITWEDFDSGIRAQRFDSSGNPLGAELGIQQVGRNFEQQPDLAVAPNGDFVISWNVFGGAIYARAFRADGTPKGNDFQLSNPTTAGDSRPAIALDASGNPVIAWVDAAKDGSGNGIFAQRLLSSELENFGTSGADRLVGTAVSDRFAGGAGNDTLSGGEGDDSLFGDAGNDRLNGDRGNDRLEGGSGNDTLTGSSGRDTLVGGGGSDQLFGGNDRDSLAGGLGRDRLDGGSGSDILSGGGGSDRFVLRRREGRDTIVDFQNGSDRLALAGGLRFSDLTITASGRNTLIRAGSDQLALLQSISVGQITSADFVSI
ncbi:MAG: hypothetical protein HY785_09630 [Oscillatoriophycideae cyanobacterium NC_groundwater_1537_Pr4_S-0.65um_50_18]|nr:hypothetical protein [Oscillatoriophycideae cyanobacterium NC_groundwater_1537_Pr4_S-0.65um_50_18]